MERTRVFRVTVSWLDFEPDVAYMRSLEHDVGDEPVMMANTTEVVCRQGDRYEMILHSSLGFRIKAEDVTLNDNPAKSIPDDPTETSFFLTVRDDEPELEYNDRGSDWDKGIELDGRDRGNPPRAGRLDRGWRVV